MQWFNAGLMLVHRLPRWPNINPTLGERFLLSVTLCWLAELVNHVRRLLGIFLLGCQIHVSPSIVRRQKHDRPGVNKHLVFSAAFTEHIKYTCWQCVVTYHRPKTDAISVLSSRDPHISSCCRLFSPNLRKQPMRYFVLCFLDIKKKYYYPVG